MKIALINTSDILGGAAIVTLRLTEALRRAGHDARMITLVKYGDNPNVIRCAKRGQQLQRFAMERACLFMRNGLNRADLFKVSIANTGMPLHRHPWVKEADVIALNWINQGTLSINGIERLCQLGKPVVWTMHDMWCMTGMCHHAYECRAYRNSCGNCQFVSGHCRSAHDVSHATWKRKQALYSHCNIHFVAVSQWLADRCRQSSLLSDKPISVIPCAFPVENYLTEPHTSLLPIDVDFSRNLIVMGAARLDDPIKGLDYAIDAFNHIFDTNPKIANQCMVVFFGGIRNSHILRRVELPYIHLGQINDPRILHELYARAKVVLSTSLYETLGATLIEGQAAGAIPVSFGEGGQTDIIDHGVNGYIADYRNSESVARYIVQALEQPMSRQFLHNEVARRFSSETIAQQYVELFQSLLNNR
jgi:glycosyltransferase involved in cell wall biosynthesis